MLSSITTHLLLLPQPHLHTTGLALPVCWDVMLIWEEAEPKEEGMPGSVGRDRLICVGENKLLMLVLLGGLWIWPAVWTMMKSSPRLTGWAMLLHVHQGRMHVT